MTALDELRQAFAEWDRLSKAATPRPWGVTNRFFRHDYRVEMFLNGEPYSTIASPSTKGNAELIVRAVELADTVRAILADAIERRMTAADWEDVDSFIRYTGRIPNDLGPALRLARAINEGADRG